MSLKRKLSALIIASIGATSLSPSSHAAPNNMADQIFRKTPAISAAALSLVAAVGTLLTAALWERQQGQKCIIDEFHSLKGNVKSNKTIDISNYPCFSSRHTFTENRVEYPFLPCMSHSYPQQGNFSARQLTPSTGFSDCIDDEIHQHQDELSNAQFHLPISASFSAIVTAITALNIFTALKQKDYTIKPLRHNA